MKTEEQFHIEFLQEKAASLGLSFADYMLFLMFETLEHSQVLTGQPDDSGFEPVWAQAYREQMAHAGGPENENLAQQAEDEAGGL